MTGLAESDVELVARAIAAKYNGRESEDWADWAPEAKAVLAALGARVLPAGGVEREEWRAHGVPGHGYPLYRYDWGTRGDEAKEWLARIRSGDTAYGRWQDGPVLVSRTVTEWPDGSMLVGAWKAVEQ